MVQGSVSMVLRTAGITAAVLLVVAASPAAADSVASIPETGEEGARSSLGEFAEFWMAKMKVVETSNRENPTVRPGSSQNLVTYRGFGEDFTVELRPTGHPGAPFIGILRYTERIYSCREVTSANCTIATTVPVTEIFRYQSGRWIY